MPTVLLIKGFRFFFYSNDHNPIHIEKDNKTAKFMIEPIELIKSNRFKSSELRQIRLILEGNIELLKQKWNEHFNNK